MAFRIAWIETGMAMASQTAKIVAPTMRVAIELL
jgi:hypothetical protein